MPQIILEYSSNIDEKFDFRSLFATIHKILSTTGGVRIENCKSRVVQQNDYFIGRGDPVEAFIHLEIQWLEGRSINLKSQLGDELLSLLKQFFQLSTRKLKVQVTVHLIDIDRKSYYKYPEGTFTIL
ncbi:MAG: 5-carboxymethyl-2-hydroxymuconate Delta-isomerase [Candidatus Hodarchaeales archaeon]|jgi:5-carboxymethyl-2-hydroxymuconate isomerase